MSKGSAKLAAVLQKRMKNISNYVTSVSAELGTITTGFGLKVDSLPNVTIKKSEYFVCKGDIDVLRAGDRVLVIWTFDGEIVVVDKILTASSL